VGVDEVLGVLYTFFESRNQLLTGTVVIEVFDSVNEVGVLCEMQVFVGFAILTHPPVATVLYGADEGQGLPVL